MASGGEEMELLEHVSPVKRRFSHHATAQARRGGEKKNLNVNVI